MLLFRAAAATGTATATATANAVTKIAAPANTLLLLHMEHTEIPGHSIQMPTQALNVLGEATPVPPGVVLDWSIESAHAVGWCPQACAVALDPYSAPLPLHCFHVWDVSKQRTSCPQCSRLVELV